MIIIIIINEKLHKTLGQKNATFTNNSARTNRDKNLTIQYGKYFDYCLLYFIFKIHYINFIVYFHKNSTIF